jgi:hypothetical protein
MARMYPRSIIESGLKSQAEGRVFEILRDGLDDDWEIYHSAGWILRDHAEGAQDGEIDFVLCHPNRAIICLEVKGGGLECRYGEFFRFVGGEKERIRDPFAQALDHRYDLQRKLDDVSPGRGRTTFIIHALAFPDITVHELVLAPDAPHEIVVDRIELRDPPRAIDQVIAFHEGSREKRRAPGEEGADALRELLAPTVTIPVPLAAEFLDIEVALLELTRSQSALLSQFGRDPRMKITGCAGSGKTILAVEQAKRRVSTGRAVGYICFNRGLRDHLRKVEGAYGVQFHTFHGLCTHLASKAGVPRSDYGSREPPPEYWSDELPNALVDASAKLGGQFDDLIIDEAQDLTDDYLAALMCTLRDEADSQVWVFLDDNQRVYDVKLTVPKDFRPFDLNINCRNTRLVHEEVVKLYQGALTPTSLGPDGREVEVVTTADQPSAVAHLVARLCGPDEVAPQDIVILSSHALERSAVGAHPPEGFIYSVGGAPTGPCVRFSSIRGFKGLEAPVVILCELEDLDDQTADQQRYVGLSRAKHHCVVVQGPGDAAT